MADTVSAVKIQDEEEDVVVSIVNCQDDITVNWLVWLNADWSSINPSEE